MFSRRRKRAGELDYWREQRGRGPLEEGVPFYKWTFTEFFGLDAGFFAGKRLLDVGCGPRGSLEWADMAAERVGADPLADRYRELHTRAHATTYVAAPAESLPFADGHFDVVSCFNALDHVEKVPAAIAEITRVCAPGGHLLLLVDIAHDPTPLEPHRLQWSLLNAFSGWDVEERRDYERPSDNMLANLRLDPAPFDHADPRERPGVLAARLVRHG